MIQLPGRVLTVKRNKTKRRKGKTTWVRYLVGPSAREAKGSLKKGEFSGIYYMERVYLVKAKEV